MKLSEVIVKIRKRGWNMAIQKLRYTPFYKMMYLSYWHSISTKIASSDRSEFYYTAIPNRGAGIGHQLGNWIAGYWFAKQLKMNFASTPFSSKKWDDFLGFGEGETQAQDLIKNKDYKVVLLPLFNEHDSKEMGLINKIISSYKSGKVIFISEQDQFYEDQFGVIDVLKAKFYNAKARANDKLLFSKTNFNIAIHVRRGDIEIGQVNQNPNLLMRWQTNDYFVNVLENAINSLATDRPIHIFLFSQGKRADFLEFEKFNNIHFCLDMGVQDSFLHMVMADMLITSKSSFSYKPALLNNGIKISPANFWHGYPDVPEFILADDLGNFDVEKLKSNL